MWGMLFYVFFYALMCTGKHTCGCVALGMPTIVFIYFVRYCTENAAQK